MAAASYEPNDPPPDEISLIVDGRVSLSLRLPGQRTVEFTSSGAGGGTG